MSGPGWYFAIKRVPLPLDATRGVARTQPEWIMPRRFQSAEGAREHWRERLPEPFAVVGPYATGGAAEIALDSLVTDDLAAEMARALRDGGPAPRHLAPDYVRAVVSAAQAVAQHVSAEGKIALQLGAAELPLSTTDRVIFHRAATMRLWKPLMADVVTAVAAVALDEGIDSMTRELAVDWLIAAAQLGAWGHAEAVRAQAVRAGAGRVLQ